MSWESAGILAAVAIFGLYHVGAIGWAWRRFVIRPTVSWWKGPAPDNRRPPIPDGIRWKVFKRDKFRCVYCGKQVKDRRELHAQPRLDHFIPWKVTKKHPAPEGFVTACNQCNSGKSDDVLEQPIEDFVR